MLKSSILTFLKHPYKMALMSLKFCFNIKLYERKEYKHYKWGLSVLNFSMILVGFCWLWRSSDLSGPLSIPRFYQINNTKKINNFCLLISYSWTVINNNLVLLIFTRNILKYYNNIITSMGNNFSFVLLLLTFLIHKIFFFKNY